MKKRLENKINKFLKEKRKSDSGYAPVEKNDISDLNDIINLLLESKFELDCDGDLPVNWEVLDRTKYEPHTAIIPVPYSHKDKEGHIKAITSNLSYYAERLDRIMRFGEIKIVGKESDE